MKNYILNMLWACFLFLSLFGYSQSSFPNSWEGNYKGELQIYGVDSIAMKLTMKLDIIKKSDSIFNWKMSYDLRGKEDIRDYELRIVDLEKGHFIIDELNTIIIDGYYKAGIFTSFFEVMNSYIISTYSKINDSIIFEIISASVKEPTVSGNKKYNDEDIPEVKAFLVNGRQKAILKKQ